MLFILSYVASFALLTACFFFTGTLVERWLLRESDLEGFRVVGQLSLGIGLWIILLFLYASLGVLSGTVILGTLVMLVSLLLWQRSNLVASLQEPSRICTTEKYRGPEALLFLCLAVMFLALFLQPLWPRVSWDANVYHLTVPRLYLENQGFWRVPFNVYSNWPLNTELLFAMAMAIRSHVLAKLVHFGMGCLVTILVYRVARESAGKWAGWVAAALFLANPIVLLEIRVAYVDLAFALFLTLAFVLVHRHLESSGDGNRQLALAGFFAGLAAGTKLTAMVGAFCLAGLLSGALLKRRAPLKEVFRSLVWLLVPVAVLLMPWFIKSWILTGNPVYPFLFQVFGGPEWSRELQQNSRGWAWIRSVRRLNFQVLDRASTSFSLGRAASNDRDTGTCCGRGLLLVLGIVVAANAVFDRDLAASRHSWCHRPHRCDRTTRVRRPVQGSRLGMHPDSGREPHDLRLGFCGQKRWDGA
jgi:hypothetical protein